MLELILYASLISSVTSVYRTIFGEKPQNTPTHTVAPKLITPQAAIHHQTKTDGEGTHAIFNVSIITQGASSSPNSEYEPAKQSSQSIGLHDITSCLYDYCSEKKYYIAASAFITSYLYIWHTVRTIHFYMQEPLAWSAWKKEFSFEQILAFPQEQLTRDLMTRIQARYIAAHNPNDFITPLISFSQDITQELELIKNHQKYINWCLKWGLNKIISIPQELPAELTERKQRIVYLNTLFQSRLAQYKLEQIAR